MAEDIDEGGATPTPWYQNVNPDTGEFTDNWRDGLPEYARDEKSLSDFKNPDAIVQAFLHTKKMQGKFDRARGYIPNLEDENLPEEDLDQMRKGLGIPTDAKDYWEGFEMPEGFDLDDETKSGFSEVLQSSNVPKSALPGLTQFYVQMREREEAARQEAQEARVNEDKAELQKLFGANFQQTVDDVARFAESRGEELDADHYLNSDPKVFKLLAGVIRDYVGEDKMNDLRGTIKTPKSNLEEANRIQTDKDHPLYAAYHGEHGFEAQDKAAAELRRLRQEASSLAG